MHDTRRATILEEGPPCSSRSPTRSPSTTRDADRQPDGSIDWDERPDVDGSIEEAYLEAISTFAHELGVERLTLRDIEIWNGVTGDDDPDLDPAGVLARLFGPRLEGCYDGATVDIAGARLLVREALRAEDDIDRPAPRRGCGAASRPRGACSSTQATTFTRTSVRPSRVPGRSRPSRRRACSPFRSRSRRTTRRPQTRVGRGAARRRGVLGGRRRSRPRPRRRGGRGAGGWTRWHRIVDGGPRPAFRPRAVVHVWPDVSTDVAGY
ncbi:hypothetical protein NKG05_04525 [Oerskovia sp. M15]